MNEKEHSSSQLSMNKEQKETTKSPIGKYFQ